MKYLPNRKYNRKLLPHKNYRILNDTTPLQDYYLCRLPIKRKNSFEKRTNPKEKFETDQFAKGLSVTLLGVFQHKDAKVRVIGKSKDAASAVPHHDDLWTPGKIPILPPNILFKRRSQFFAVKIKDVEAVPPYDVTIEYPNQGSQQEKAVFKVIHRPTLCNYWHFEIQGWNIKPDGTLHYLRNNPSFNENVCNRILKRYAKRLREQLIEKIKHSTEVKCSYISKSIYQTN